MKVTGWVNYDDIEPQGLKATIDTSGGWFGFRKQEPRCEREIANGMRWKDYLENFEAPLHHYLEALREEVIRLSLKEGGDWHQNDDAGVPVFEDGTIATFTYRGWGDLLAAVWAEAEDMDYNYMDFYMSCLVRERGSRDEEV